jgi:hypothetical protein
VIRAPKGKYLLNVPTFTTSLHLEDGNGNALGSVALDITASEWTYVTVNGLVYSLDHDTPAQIVTDQLGSVTIIALASDIAPPILHVQSKAFDKTVNIYANGKIQAGLQQIQSGTDLKNARGANGPVVDPATSQDTLDGVAGNLTQLTGATGQYVKGTRPAGTMFVAVEDGIKHTGALNLAHVPSNFAVGMTLSNGTWQAHPSPALLASAAVPMLGGVFGDIETFVGDALHWLEHAFSDGIKLIEKGVTFLKDGVSFVIQKVEEGLMFVLDLAGKAFKIVLKTLGAVFKALNWILKLIGIDLSKILAWLGHLFGWDDIWKAHKILASVMRSGLDCASSKAVNEIESWRAKVKAELSGVGDKVKHLILPPATANAQPRQQMIAAAKQPEAVSAHTPQAKFTAYQIQHGGMLSGDATGPSKLAAASGDPVRAFMSDVVEPAISKILADLEKAADDLYQAFADPSHTMQHLADLLGDLVDLVVDTVLTIVDGTLALVEKLIGAMRSALEDDIDLPFISDFYDFITDLLGDDEQLTVINGVALLLAIPVVEICKIAGRSPFDGAEDTMSDPQLLSKMTSSGSNAAQPVAMMASQAMARAANAPVAAAHPQMVAFAASSGGPVGITEDAAAQYTAWGSIFGGFSGWGAACCSLITTNNSDDPFLKKIPVRSVATGLSLARFALTFPWKAPPWKTTAWAVGTALTVVDYFLTNAKVRGGLTTLRGVSGLILSVVQDGISNPQPSWLVYSADITSNIGAAALGVNMIKPNIYTTGGGLFLGFTGATFALSYGLTNEAHTHAITNAGA